MRILMSVHFPMDTKLSPAGVTFCLAQALRARGHSVDILSHDNSNGLRGKGKALLYPLFVASYIARQAPYDVLDLSSGDGCILSLLPRACLGTPRPLVVARSHCLEHVAHEVHLELSRLGLKKLSWKYPIYHGGVRLWECRTSFALADLALFLNDSERQYAIQRLGVRPNRAAVVKNGIAELFIERARTLLAFPNRIDPPKNIAFIGRYSELKGRRYLRSAMRSILSRYPESTLGLFGVMKESNEVLADYPPEFRHRITVVRTYANEDLVNLLSGYHILAFPSIVEGFGISPLEAMACGLVPVVAAAQGPMSYIQDGRNGIVVPLRDSSALESAITKLLVDTQRWHDLRSRALSTALNYSYGTIAAELEELYVTGASTARRPATCMELS